MINHICLDLETNHNCECTSDVSSISLGPASPKLAKPAWTWKTEAGSWKFIFHNPNLHEDRNLKKKKAWAYSMPKNLRLAYH